MKYVTTVANKEYTIEVIDEKHISVNGKVMEVDFESVSGQPVYSMLIDGKSYESYVYEGEEDWQVLLLGRQYPIKVEDERERLVLADHPPDEPPEALDGILDLGDVLTGLVVRGWPRGGDPQAGRGRRDGEVEHDVRPEQRLVQLQHPVEIQPSRHVTGQTREQKAVGNDELSSPERREDLLLDSMAEIGGVQQRELLGTQRPDCLAAPDERPDQIGGVPLRRDDVVPLRLHPRLEQLALRRLTRPIGPFERDEPAAGLSGEMPAGALTQEAEGWALKWHVGDP